MEELTPEQYQAKIAELEGKLEVATKENADQAAEIELLKEENEEQVNKIVSLNKIIGSAKAQTKLEVSKEKAEKPVLPTEAIEVDDKEYKWKRNAFRLPGDAFIHFAATANEKVIRKVLAIKGQTILEEQA